MERDEQFEKAWVAVSSLAAQFSSDLALYLSSDFREAEVRKDFDTDDDIADEFEFGEMDEEYFDSNEEDEHGENVETEDDDA